MHAHIAEPRHWSLLLVLLGFKWEKAKMVALSGSFLLFMIGFKNVLLD
jgi:hypothetical protein